MTGRTEQDEAEAREFFARVGLTVYRALLLEVRLREYLRMVEEVEERQTLYRSMTFGQLVGALRKRPGTEALVAVLDQRVDERNRLAHHLLWDHADEMVTRDGRASLTLELHGMCERSLEANKLVRRAIIEHVVGRGGVSEADVERALRAARIRAGLSPDLPPHLR